MGGARVAVGGLGLGDEVVELHEGVRAQGGAEQLGHGIHGGELGGQVREVGEGELARVGALGDAEVDDVGGEEVVDCVGAGLDGGLGFGVAVEAAEDEFDLGFDLGERGFCLEEGPPAVLDKDRVAWEGTKGGGGNILPRRRRMRRGRGLGSGGQLRDVRGWIR